MERFQKIKNKTDQVGWYQDRILNADDVLWLIEKINQQNKFIKELRETNARWQKYWEIAEKQYNDLKETAFNNEELETVKLALERDIKLQEK